MHNTEEDTFNTLRRTPFIQVMNEFVNITDILGIKDHLKSHGWTHEEFNDYYRKRYVSDKSPYNRKPVDYE